ncbi:hypothetical protein GCM10017044_22860 [Kordiimonas sediminis]|uniref:Tetratricopeptide repeat protein n=1 Tax=Kordiimonas sediminis TaxID=1735581 RepID=A0A919AUT0_9PROT|nr:tetratricopeptide repeat protein [Kordiimonas sediminis]GHF27238.1 hypothetical protein GCM10017044_22860 [Kordiimonas sediminis]
MRFLSTVIVSAMLSTAATTAVISQQTSEKYQSISQHLVAEANAVLDSEAAEARSLYERALTADPSNIQAMIGIARTYEKVGRIGSSLKYYRKALELDPNDRTALTEQALAFLLKDMPEKADDNRLKLSQLCPNGCAALEKTETAIEAYRFDQEKEANETKEATTSDNAT